MDRMLAPRPANDGVPLTFSQQRAWRVLELDERPGSRSLAVASRITGPLSVQPLRQCIVALVRRHEALRTRIVTTDGIPLQVVDEAEGFDLEIVDLSEWPANERDGETTRLLEELVHEPIDVAIGPLFKARLLRLGISHHVLVLAMDHIISDAASVSILLRELWTLYAQSVSGAQLALPKIAMQFADYALWQRQSRESWIKQHGAYWSEHLDGARRLILFPDTRARRVGPVKLDMLPVQIGANLSEELLEFSRRARTTPALTALSAYCAVISRWCEETDIVVTLIHGGRLHSAVKGTAGFFAAPLFLRVRLRAEDTFRDLLGRVFKEYCNAEAHADSGRVAAQRPTPEFVGNPRFNWIPQESNMRPETHAPAPQAEGVSALEQTALSIRPRDDFDERDGGPELLLMGSHSTVTGVFFYRNDLTPVDVATRFIRKFAFFLKVAIATPDSRLAALPCER